MNDALKPLRDKIAEWQKKEQNLTRRDPLLLRQIRELESLLPQLEQTIRAEVQAAEANALNQVKDILAGTIGQTKYDDEALDKVRALIPPASQTLLDALVAEARLKEHESSCADCECCTACKEKCERGNALRAASQPTPGAGKQ